MGNSLVQMKNIAKSFSGTKVLKGVNLELDHGEILAFLGKNSAGNFPLRRRVNEIKRIEDKAVLQQALNAWMKGQEMGDQGGRITDWLYYESKNQNKIKYVIQMEL